MEEELLLIETSVLQCSCGSSPSQLKVTSVDKHFINDNLRATEEDNKAYENIFPFGICSLTQKTCEPAPQKWLNKVDWCQVNGMASITDRCKLSCSKGGLITCKDAGQYLNIITRKREEEEKPVYNSNILFEAEDREEEETDKGYIVISTSPFGGNKFYKYTEGKLYTQADDAGMYEKRFKTEQFNGKLETDAQKIYDDLELLRANSEGKKLLDFFDKEKHYVTIMIPQPSPTSKNEDNHTNGQMIRYQGKPIELPIEEYKTEYSPSYIVLGHEMGHVKSFHLGTLDTTSLWNKSEGVMIDEIYATHIENKLRMSAGMKLRDRYGRSISSDTYMMDKFRNSYYINKNESNYPANPPERLEPKDAFNYNSIK